MTSLGKDLTERIARDLGISPEEVTTEYIHEWREKHLYPKLKVSFGVGGLGGHVPITRRVKTTEEIEAEREEAAEILRELVAIEDSESK